MEVNSTVKEIFGTENLNNDQNVIQAINKAIKISEASIEQSTLTAYKWHVGFWKMLCHIFEIMIGLIYLNE